jgi:osmotically inducible lipoprotein OsmB
MAPALRPHYLHDRRLEASPYLAREDTEMKKQALVMIAGAAIVLAGCGTQMGDRLASGAAIGAGAGAIAGGVGAIPGALVGAAVGGLTSPDQVNLGRPLWDE